MLELMDRLGYTPRNCVWEITRACNLSCAHCGTGAGARRRDELDTAECLDLVDQLAALGTGRITLSGGEPTLRPDWPEIARAATDRGVMVNMVTNGQGDPSVLARRARGAGLANVAVSLDGLWRTHDAIRRPGAFARATDTIRTLVARGVWTHVMLTANRLNLDEVGAVYQVAHRLGARGFRVQLGKPMGNQSCRDDLTLQPRHLMTLLPELGRLARAPGPRVDVGDSIGYFSSHERALRGHRCSQGHWTGCYAGCQAIGIQADGGIKGCLSLQPRAGEEDRFLEGNVREAALRDIWLRPGAFSYNREFSVDQLTGQCADCSYAAICRGGATCVAHAYTGEVGCDPMCFHAASLAAAGKRKRAWAHAAAATAAAMALALGGGCSSAHAPHDDGGTDSDLADDGGADAGDAAGGDADADVDADADADTDTDGVLDGDVDTPLDADPVDCSEVECTCFVCDDYGDPGPSACDPCSPMDDFLACCCRDSCEYCDWVCCDCDYGEPDPSPPMAFSFCCEDPGSDSGSGGG